MGGGWGGGRAHGSTEMTSTSLHTTFEGRPTRPNQRGSASNHADGQTFELVEGEAPSRRQPRSNDLAERGGKEDLNVAGETVQEGREQSPIALA